MSEVTEATTSTEVELSTLSDTDLVEFEALLVSEYESKRTSVEEFSAEDESSLTEIASAIEAARAEMNARVVRAERDAKVGGTKGAEFLAKVAAKTPVTEEAPADVVETEPVAEVTVATEPVVEPTVEAVEKTTFSAPNVILSPEGLKGDKPPVAEKPAGSIIASADVPGFKPGQELADLSQIAEAFVAKRPQVRGNDPSGDGTRFLVASVRGDYPEERILGDDPVANAAKISAVNSPSALAASGGLCAPLTPRYQLTVWGDANRPVRDALPSFAATRGGIRYLPAPRIDDLVGSVRRTTAAQDAAGYTNQDPAGSTAPKPCLHVTCEAEQECIVEAVSKCLTFGNFGSRTYPEQVQAWLTLGNAEFARYAEVELLDAIEAGSTHLHAEQTYGATFSILEQIALTATSFRARNRLSQNAPLRVILPFWLPEILRTDIAGQAPGDGLDRYDISNERIAAWLRSRGVVVTWAQDTSTSAGAPWDNPVAPGTIQGWPTYVDWYLFPEGAWIYLDGGALDLGIVRDSTLNSQNDYQIFYEEFFGACLVGIESFWVTSHLCANGTYANGSTVRTCPANS